MLIKNECKGFQFHFVQLRTFKVFSVPQLHKETNKKIHPPIPCLPAKVITPLYENVLIKNQISYRHKINYSSGHKNGVLSFNDLSGGHHSFTMKQSTSATALKIILSFSLKHFILHSSLYHNISSNTVDIIKW